MLKELPKTKLNPDNLFLLPYQALKWELVKTAIELNLFDSTTSQITAAELSTTLSLHSANTEHMLNALVALGYLNKKNDLYCNTQLSEQFLTSGKDTSLSESILFFSNWSVPSLNGGLKDMVKNGPPPKRDIADPSLWEKGAKASLNYTRSGRAQMIAEMVSQLPEFPSFTKILDMGSGPGIIGIAVVKEHPRAKGVLFDQPPVNKVAREVVKEYSLEDRVEVLGGDYSKDDIGSGYDLVMANYTLNFYKNNLVDIMRRVIAALKPGGICMVSSDGIDPDGTSPAASIISWLPTMLQGDELSLQTGQISRAMLDAGFISTERVKITSSNCQAHGPIEITIGRKGN